MNKQLQHEYTRFRKVGCGAIDSLYNARVVVEWREFEWDDFSDPQIGDCRLRAEPDDCPYDSGDMDKAYTDIYGRRVSAEEAQREIDQMLERDGVWGVIAEFWNGERWEQTDSIWNCAGYENVLDPIENAYVIDHMASAIKVAKAAQGEVIEQ